VIIKGKDLSDKAQHERTSVKGKYFWENEAFVLRKKGDRETSGPGSQKLGTNIETTFPAGRKIESCFGAKKTKGKKIKAGGVNVRRGLRVSN